MDKKWRAFDNHPAGLATSSRAVSFSFYIFHNVVALSALLFCHPASNAYICVCHCVLNWCRSCGRPDCFPPWWLDHSWWNPPTADTCKPGVPQRANLWHRDWQHQQHHTTGDSHCCSPLCCGLVISLLYLLLTSCLDLVHDRSFAINILPSLVKTQMCTITMITHHPNLCCASKACALLILQTFNYKELTSR